MFVYSTSSKLSLTLTLTHHRASAGGRLPAVGVSGEVDDGLSMYEISVYR